MNRFLRTVFVFVIVTVGVNAQQTDEAVKPKTTIKLENPAERIRSAAFSPNGEKVLLLNDFSIQVRSTETGEVLQTFPAGILKPNRVPDFAWQPNGSQIVFYNVLLAAPSSGKQDERVAFLWNVENGKIAATLTGADKPIQFAKWNKAGNRILTSNVYWDEISVWTADGALVARKRAEGIHSINFTNDGSNLLVSQEDDDNRSALEIWSGDKLTLFKSLQPAILPDGDRANAKYVVKSFDGALLCGSIGFSKGVACWETTGDGSPKYVFPDDKINGDYSFLGFSKNSKSFLLAKSKGGKIEIVNAADGSRKSPTTNFNDQKRRVYLSVPFAQNGGFTAWSVDDRFLVVKTNERTDILNAKTTDFVATINLTYETQTVTTEQTTATVVKKQSGGKSSGGKSPGKNSGGKKDKDEYETVYETTYDYETQVVDYETLYLNPAHQILIAVTNSEARILSLETGTVLQSLAVHPNHRNLVQWSQNGDLLLTLEGDSTVMVRDVAPLVK